MDDEGQLICNKIRIGTYSTSYFEADWSLVGTHKLLQQAENGVEVSMRKKRICGKGAINRDTISVFSIDMWQV